MTSLTAAMPGRFFLPDTLPTPLRPVVPVLSPLHPVRPVYTSGNGISPIRGSGLPTPMPTAPRPSLLGLLGHSGTGSQGPQQTPGKGIAEVLKAGARFLFDQTFARKDRAIVVTTVMGALEFSLLSPTLNYLTSHVIAMLDPAKSAEFTIPDASSVAKIAIICAGIGATLFGLSGIPKILRDPLESTVGKALTHVLHPDTVQGGFVYGKVPRINAAHPQVIRFLSNRLTGQYTRADPVIWAYEIGINLFFYPAIGWALHLPLAQMLPAVAMSVCATIGTARMCKIWGGDDRPFWWMILGRTSMFSIMNAISPLAPTLAKADILPVEIGYLVQGAMVLALSVGAFFMVKPKEGVAPQQAETS